MIALVVKSESNINGIMVGIANHWDLTLLPFVGLWTWIQTNSMKTNLTNVDEESSCNEKVTDIPVEVIPVKTHIKDKVKDTIQHWNTKKSKLEADPNLEKVW